MGRVEMISSVTSGRCPAITELQKCSWHNWRVLTYKYRSNSWHFRYPVSQPAPPLRTLVRFPQKISRRKYWHCGSYSCRWKSAAPRREFPPGISLIKWHSWAADRPAGFEPKQNHLRMSFTLHAISSVAGIRNKTVMRRFDLLLAAPRISVCVYYPHWNETKSRMRQHRGHKQLSHVCNK